MKSVLAFLMLIFAIQVKAQLDGDVRLVDGLTVSSGRVEVYYQGRWGTVCDDGFNAGAAQVVCQSVGISDARPTRSSTNLLPGSNSGTIFLDEVRCIGNESNILHCGHRSIGTSDCSHFEDVGVDCYGQDLGKVAELQNGTSTDGVLVLNYGGLSGTVCFSASWGQAEARVACRMLGHDNAGVSPLTVDRTFYGENTNMPVLMSQIECQGNENDLSECLHRGMGESSCVHSSDIAIDCLAENNFEVSLTNGNATFGELQFAYYTESGPLCGFGIARRDMHVYCSMIGLPQHYGVHVGNNRKDNTTGFYYSTNCNGSESNILDCQFRYPLHLGDCNTSPIISCLPYADMNVRIAVGNSTFGRLEVQYNNGVWGTICDDMFDNNAAKVFCRMLNLPAENAMAIQRPYYPIDRRIPILLDDVSCSGTETHVNECFHNTMGDHNCAHYEDVWIHCA